MPNHRETIKSNLLANQPGSYKNMQCYWKGWIYLSLWVNMWQSYIIRY